jgi:hypothetical protein
MLQEQLEIPARDSLAAEAIRQMARDLRSYEAEHAANVGEVLDRTTTYLRNHLGRTPTPAEVARTGGLDIEDIIDEISRRSRAARSPLD